MQNQSKQKKFIAIVVLILCILLTQLLLYTLPRIISHSDNQISLAGEVEFCEPGVAYSDTGDLPKTIKRCTWQKNKIPSRIDRLKHDGIKDFVIYRKNFPTADWCKNSKNPCALTVGIAYDAMLVILNGHILDSQSSYSFDMRYPRFIPHQIILPNEFLNPVGDDNELHLVVRSFDKTYIGIIDPLISILPRNTSTMLVHTWVGTIIILPLFSALIIFSFAIIGLWSSLHEKIKDPLLEKYIYYCIASSLHLFSLTRLFMHYIDLNFSSTIHICLRFVANYFFAALICLFFKVPNSVLIFMKRLTVCTLVFVLLIYILSSSSIGHVPPYWMFETAYWYLYVQVLLPTLIALLILSYPHNKLEPLHNFWKCFFIVLLIMQFHDCLAVWEVLPSFYFVRFYPFFIALTFGYLILKQKLKLRSDLEISAHMGTLATQVAHDIRSPLAALEVVAADITQLPDSQRALIQQASSRIHDIANNLLLRYKSTQAISTSSEISYQSLAPLIEAIITEKRLQYQSLTQVNIQCIFSTHDSSLASQINPSEFQCILSNLINNAVEAFSDNIGTVTVSLNSHSQWNTITISDTGKGIPLHILDQLLSTNHSHTSYGKQKGFGLGLTHAKQCLSAWGGRLHITSTVGVGTSVCLELPRS